MKVELTQSGAEVGNDFQASVPVGGAVIKPALPESKSLLEGSCPKPTLDPNVTIL